MSTFYSQVDSTPFLKACDQALAKINEGADAPLTEIEWGMIARTQHAAGMDHAVATKNAGAYGCAMCDEPHLYDEDWNYIGYQPKS